MGRGRSNRYRAGVIFVIALVRHMINPFMRKCEADLSPCQERCNCGFNLSHTHASVDIDIGNDWIPTRYVANDVFPVIALLYLTREWQSALLFQAGEIGIGVKNLKIWTIRSLVSRHSSRIWLALFHPACCKANVVN